METLPIWVVGVGPGDPAYLTRQAIDLIETAHLVAGFRLPLETAAERIRGDRVLLDYGNQVERLAELAIAASKGLRCVVCAQGDPGFSGRELVQRVEAAWPRVEVVPGISSVQIACARAGIEMDRAFLLTFHKRGDTEQERREFVAAVAGGSRHTVALPRPFDFMPAAMACLLLEQGVSRDRQATVYERLTLPGECQTQSSLGDLAASRREFSDLSILLIPAASP